MSRFLSPSERAPELAAEIREVVWDRWSEHWSDPLVREQHLATLVRTSLNLFDYVLKHWGPDPEVFGPIEKALLFSMDAHAAQAPRKTGEPYVQHPITVATSCAEHGLDSAGIVSALLHDTIEDTSITEKEIRRQFGRDVAEIVAGLSKVKSTDKALIDRDKVLTFFRIFGGAQSDNLLRTIIIKIFDRLDNMKTVDVFRVQKQQRYGEETLYIYSSLATILGMKHIATELVVRSIPAFFPDKYLTIKAKSDQRMHVYIRERTALQDVIKRLVGGHLETKFIHLYPTIADYLDPVSKTLLQFETMPLHMRLRVPTIADMYALVGYIHSAHLEMPSAGITVLSDSFKDYVVSPLANGYCALTTTVSFRKQTWLLEIVTRDLEQQVDWGILSDFKNAERRKFYYTSILAFRDNFQDIQNLRYADLKSLTSSAVADIHVRCRHDRIVQLPAGSTVLDLAYVLDPDLGLYCKGAMVNGRFESPLYPLRHGEHVEVQTSDEPFIQENLLTLLRSRVAVEHYRERVKTYFMVKAYELGREVLMRFMALHQIPVEKVFDARGEPRQLTQDEIIDLGVGKFTVAQMLESHGLFTPQGGLFSRPVMQVPRIVRSLYDHMYRMPDCCTVFPMVDREVVMQYFPDTSQSSTLGLIEIHRSSCDRLSHDRPRIPVEWSITLGSEMGLDLWVEDGVGLASKITGVIARNHLNIISLHADSREQDNSNLRHIFLSIELRLAEHAPVDQRHLISCIKMLRGIKEIRRILIHKE